MYTVKTFFTGKEAEESMRQSIPPILWKYRDWTDPNHQRALRIPSVYFAHPKDLNDPFDIRVPIEFDYSEIDNPLFIEKLKEQTAIRYPRVPLWSYAFLAIVQEQYRVIKNNPKAYFEKNVSDLRDSDAYDAVGLFSLSKSPINEVLWGCYASSNKGFCIGYDSIELHKYTPTSSGPVDYNGAPVKHSFIKPQDPYLLFQEHYRKAPKWSSEEEYRFITLIDAIGSREVPIPTSCIKEVVFGFNTPEEHKREIVEVLKEKFNSQVHLYVVERNLSSYGFTTKAVDY